MDIDLKTIQAYLDGCLPDDESQFVQAYLAEHISDPEVNTLLDKEFDMCRTDSLSSAREALSVTRGRLGLGRGRLVRTLTRVAAVILLALMVPGLLYTGYRLHREPAPVAWHEITVPTAQTRQITLPDGTRLVLNAESRMTWPEKFTGEAREIFLEGEIRASVAKDPGRPFIIHSDDVDIKVYGTTFNFKSYKGDSMVQLMLEEGSVGLGIPGSGGRREVRLTPGDIAQFDRPSGELSLGKVDPRSFKPFSEDRSFSFFNVPLSDIASELERSFGEEIVVADPEITSRRFLAFFTNHETLDQILAMLAANGGLNVTRSGGVVYINGKKHTKTY